MQNPNFEPFVFYDRRLGEIAREVFGVSPSLFTIHESKTMWRDAYLHNKEFSYVGIVPADYRWKSFKEIMEGIREVVGWGAKTTITPTKYGYCMEYIFDIISKRTSISVLFLDGAVYDYDGEQFCPREGGECWVMVCLKNHQK